MVKRRIEQLRALSIFEWWLMLVSIILFPFAALLLWVVGFNRSQSLLRYFITAGMKRNDSTSFTMNEVRIISRMVRIAANHGPCRVNCLKQALVLWWLLARHGLNSEIKFGVEKTSNDAIDAHAWVEYNGTNLCVSADFQHHYLVLEP